MRKFKTEVTSLQELEEYQFSIPTYQRPYVWEDEQLKKLLDDFFLHFNKSSSINYYLGSILTKEESSIAELIDGQQRFTTLWIISLVLKSLESNSELDRFLQRDEELRLGFEIRTEISDYLKHLLKNTEELKNYNEESINDYPYLKNISKAIVFIKGYFSQKGLTKKKLKEFGDFIYHKVKFIKNTTPENTDLNKLFSTINSAGLQLEQTDIVKANLLACIDDKVQYGKIWEACENMNTFFEKGINSSFPNTNRHLVDLKKYTIFSEEIFKFKQEENTTVINEPFSIDKLKTEGIKEYVVDKKNTDKEEGREESDKVFCRSIINFGQLLIHTYRIHLKKEKLDDFEGTFHVNRLIEIFDSLKKRNNKEEIKRFFLLLWEVRYLFDKYIIKWISDIDNKSENLEIMSLNKNSEGYYSRSKYEKSSTLMLQSVLYFTGDYLRQYWLTSYLDYLYYHHNNLPATEVKHLEYLEKLDNIFSLSEEISDKVLSWKMLHQSENFKIKEITTIKNYLLLNKGTGFKHYWFQKLEYVLWKNWEEEKTDGFHNFRIMSKNSIEHIYPQNPENIAQQPKSEDESLLHSFGNLVLLSVSQNSEYSNKSFSVKRSMFQDKKNTYDTLKSFYIFQKGEWNKEKIESHKNLMIEKIIKYYTSSMSYE